MEISKNHELLQAALEFKQAYIKLEPSQLDPYNQQYYKRYLHKLDYSLYLTCHLIEIADQQGRFNKVIDLGGGIGFQSAFLASLGRDWEVHYLDADEASFRSAQLLNAQIDLKNIHYHQGELTVLEDLLDQDCLIISRDVIEHIYDLKSFFKLSAKAGFNVHNTAAIKDSWLRAREFEAIHRRAELEGNPSATIKSRDNRQSYFGMRLDLIRSSKPDLAPEHQQAMAEASRGLALEDLKHYIQTEEYPEGHLSLLGTNTCDPLTGNWAERTLSKTQYGLLAGNLELAIHYPKYNLLDNQSSRKALLSILNIFAQSRIHQIQPSFSIAY